MSATLWASGMASRRVRSLVSSSAAVDSRDSARVLRDADCSLMAVVSAPQVVISGTQLAFGSQDSDFKLAFERLEKALAVKNVRFDQVVLAHLYVTASALATRALGEVAPLLVET